MTLFNYDWFTGPAFAQQESEAALRCACRKFPDVPDEQRDEHHDFQKFLSELELRTLLYLRDGFSYELKERVDVGLHSNLLTFECEPVDDHYKVGSFIVTVPFDEILRVETYAVHPSEKPEDVPIITGFRTTPSEVSMSRDDTRDEAKPAPTVE